MWVEQRHNTSAYNEHQHSKVGQVPIIQIPYQEHFEKQERNETEQHADCDEGKDNTYGNFKNSQYPVKGCVFHNSIVVPFLFFVKCRVTQDKLDACPSCPRPLCTVKDIVAPLTVFVKRLVWSCHLAVFRWQLRNV